MKRLTQVLALIPFIATGCQGHLAGYKGFGGPVKESSAVTVTDAVRNAPRYAGKSVTMRGEIREVCPNMGCWMTVTDGTETVRVRFTESDACSEGFVVPRNAAGRKVVLNGTIKPVDISQAVARHYAEESGKSKSDIEKIVGSQKTVMVFATGVMISDGAALDPPVK